jgi:hypothetical protein
MPLPLKRLAVAAAILVFACLVGQHADAESNRVTFPENIDELEHYTTVTRGNVTEHMLTSREAIEAAQRGEPMPEGTHVVLVDYREGEVFRYFVMQKGPGWGADYDEDRRTGDWQFQWFHPDRTIKADENTARCQSCHGRRADNEFMFTFNDLMAFE